MRQNSQNWRKKRIFPSFWKKKLGDTISLCMIMRNEEKLLPRCLKSVKGLVDEIIICDTGSTDKSIQIARAHGAKVLQDPWQDDFGRPRNIAIAQATMNYILVLDPDEVISHADHDKLREHTRHPEVIAWRMDTRNYTNNPWMSGCRQNPGDFLNAQNFYGFVPSTKTRFFQNHRNIFFQKCWHELLDYDIAKYKYKFDTSSVPVHHYPHEINQDNVEIKKKFYLKLGRKKAALDPGDCQAQWELAVAEHIAGNHRRAYRACLLSMRSGKYGSDRLFFLAAINKSMGGGKGHNLIFTKAICKVYPNLTHINPADKTPLHEAPKKPGQIKPIAQSLTHTPTPDGPPGDDYSRIFYLSGIGANNQRSYSQVDTFDEKGQEKDNFVEVPDALRPGKTILISKKMLQENWTNAVLGGA